MPPSFLGYLLREIPTLLETEREQLVAKRELSEGAAALGTGDLAGPVEKGALDSLVALGRTQRALGQLLLLALEAVDALFETLDLVALIKNDLPILRVLPAKARQLRLAFARDPLLRHQLLVPSA